MDRVTGLDGLLPPGADVELDSGTRLWVHDTGPCGQEPPVVLLHGLGATAALNWFGVFDAVSRGRRVIALDLPGHGRSPRRERFRLDGAADAVAELLDHLGTGPCIVAGYSMGGVIAQLVAHRHPAAVAGLVLCATSRDFRGAPADRMRFGAASLARFAARLTPVTPFNLVGALARRRPGDRWQLAAEVARSSYLAICEATDELGRFTSRTWVGGLTAPAAVVITTKDRLVPTRRQRRLAESLTNAVTVEVDGDHLVAGRDPVRFLRGFRAALRAVDHATRSQPRHHAA